jgi:hypothetical protein
LQELMHVREPDPEPALEAERVDAGAVLELQTRSWLTRLVAAIPPRQV